MSKLEVYYQFLSESEITDKIYCTSAQVSWIPDEFREKVVIIDVDQITFLQDPFIVLEELNPEKSKKKMIVVDKKIEGHVDLSILKSLSSFTDQDMGGNFVTSWFPREPVFYIPSLSDPLKNYLQSEIQLVNPMIEWECSFRFHNYRHMDELLCFMPGNPYSIWVYSVQSIVPTPSLQKQCQNKDLSSLIQKVKKHFQQNAPRKPSPTSEMYDYLSSNYQKLIRGYDAFISQKFQKKSLRQYKTFMDYLPPILSRNIQTMYNLIDKSDYYSPGQLKLFQEEYKRNKKKLISSLRAKEEWIHEFPLHLYVDENKNYTIRYPSLCNRVILKNESKTHIIFPDIPDPKLKELVRSLLPPEVSISFVKTSSFHSSSSGVGGNVHCLIKTT